MEWIALRQRAGKPAITHNKERKKEESKSNHSFTPIVIEWLIAFSSPKQLKKEWKENETHALPIEEPAPSNFIIIPFDFTVLQLTG